MKEHKGTSTLTMLKLTEGNKLRSLNIGDSGYSIFRIVEGELKSIHRSPSTMRRFNFPYQVG
jgi:hypothetical protein